MTLLWLLRIERRLRALAKLISHASSERVALARKVETLEHRADDVDKELDAALLEVRALRADVASVPRPSVVELPPQRPYACLVCGAADHGGLPCPKTEVRCDAPSTMRTHPAQGGRHVYSDALMGSAAARERASCAFCTGLDQTRGCTCSYGDVT